MDGGRYRAFISYSHNDKKHLERLQVHLKGFLNVGDEKESLNFICDNVWDDSKIAVGSDWQKEIRDALNQAKLAVLLVSADFFGSDFIRDKELKVLLEAARTGQVQVVPVILSASVFERTELSNYQSINPVTEPLMKMKPDEQEELWQRLADRIYSVLNPEKSAKN